MKTRILFLFKFFLTALFVGIFGKVIFLLYNGWGRDISFSDVFNIFWHGLPLDVSFSGYLSAVLWIILLAAYWIGVNRWIFYIYFGIVALLQAVVYIVDTGLFEFWNFKLDATIFNYLDSPTEVFASVSTLYTILSIGCILLATIGLFLLFKRTLTSKSKERIAMCRLNIVQRVVGTVCHCIAGALLFLAIRGGLGVSTANPGMVYFSDKPFLNASAVNPAFNLFYSMSKIKDFSKRGQAFSEEDFSKKWIELQMNTESRGTISLIDTLRPNVLLVILEGCGRALYDAPNVMPNLKKVAAEGVEFINCYANSFRTDRGVVCTLSGFPAYPDVSVMKLTESKISHLPSIARSLSRAGYTTEFIYGGDINFTNTNGYLLSTGYNRTYSEVDFPSEERNNTKWGVHDEFAFRRTLKTIEAYPTDKPWMLTLLTLSSHEPWEVPYNRIENDEIDNAFAYLDECIGEFIQNFKKTEAWENTLVVFVPDHGLSHHLPEETMAIEKNKIPLIFSGGVIKQEADIDILCNQSDLAATLLGQLNIAHDDFIMSRDVLSMSYTNPFAINAWSQSIVWIQPDGTSVYDLNTKEVTQKVGNPSKKHVDHILTYMQSAYRLLK
ncbi:MAG: sulfatase-like hydrolase/transferase [Bacteroidaceae bacterium]|jgi:phosphoglycerol transferase MdoB-like AlkP superfamily enzyme|nr:sulfatase-like hydrolase/transferase [Bacteroidaceae bacterium]